ncbi:Hep_Hag family protein, partial [Rhodanobacter fulvus Jip2]
MNTIYSKVWNTSLGMLVVASELARIRGKSGATGAGCGQRRLGVGTVCGAMLAAAMALPSVARADVCLGTFTLSFGHAPSAQGNAFACGRDAMASGQYSTALGNQSLAKGRYSLANGYQSNALGNNSTAVGYGVMAQNANTTALGANSAALGTAATATGAGSLALGDDATATGANSAANGLQSSAY